MIFLSLGSNVGNRLENLRIAISKLSFFFDCKKLSHVIESRAILPDNAPADWDMNFLNMVIAGETSVDAFSLLALLKNIEREMGRETTYSSWSPRIIDVDIIAYHDLCIYTDELSIPHREIRNRDFLQYLLASISYQIPANIRINTEKYVALNYFVLDPRLVGIVNVTPDSFSDGGAFFDFSNAENQIRKLYNDGANIIELGAQSTHPGYVEIPPTEEISRLGEIFERVGDINCLGIDTYFDNVVEFALQKPNIHWINDIKSQISDNVIKLIADKNAKLIIMLYGMDPSWLETRAKYLRNLGMKKENIILDPGVGFAKTKRENIEMIKNISRIKEMGYEILLGHSRKSCFSAFSNADAPDRDIETIAISDFAKAKNVDYLRIHNVKDHMRFFVAKHCIT
jgi:2-amino-4-hydroxy-6-hydroxymethyldihydropteridine diphosphokinase/dihydropteroate synthase